MLNCKWRWGYALKMIRRYFDLKVEINQLDAGEVLHVTTEARLQELGDMLQDCVNLIFFIEGSRYVTLSCVPFALYYLLQHTLNLNVEMMRLLLFLIQPFVTML